MGDMRSLKWKLGPTELQGTLNIDLHRTKILALVSKSGPFINLRVSRLQIQAVNMLFVLYSITA